MAYSGYILRLPILNPVVLSRLPYVKLCAVDSRERPLLIMCSLVRGVVTLVAMLELVEFLYILLRTRLRCSDIALDIVTPENSKTGVNQGTYSDYFQALSSNKARRHQS